MAYGCVKMETRLGCRISKACVWMMAVLRILVGGLRPVSVHERRDGKGKGGVE